MRWLALVLVLVSSVVAARERLLVFAAASLKNALDEANAAYGAAVVASYAASSALARQIERGAPAQVFLSADEDWMDYLERKGLLEQASRRNLLGNRLVWIAPASRPIPPSVVSEPLSVLKGGRLALADPQHVPAGKYAKAALEKTNLWTSVAGRVAAAENVRAALALVARGESPLGIVYETDARAEPKVIIVARIDPRLHPPILYPGAAVRGGGAEARRYLEFLAGARAARIFDQHGFDVGR